VAGRPILEHVLDIYARQGARRFILAAGYKIEMVSRFAESLPSSWEVQVIDTGSEADTGSRILRCRQHLTDPFFATYGDGVGNINLTALLDYHIRGGAAATITTVPLPSQYGTVDTNPSGRVMQFKEKPVLRDHWINGGFFVMESRVFDHWVGNDLEKEVLPALAAGGELQAYRHHGFWKSMDTYKDAVELTELAGTGIPPWHAEVPSALVEDPGL